MSWRNWIHVFRGYEKCAVVFSCQVADDGYGVSYIISGEDTIYYHITCKVSSQFTVSTFVMCRFVLRGETLNYRSGAVAKELLKTVF